MLLWFYVQELPKAQLAVVLVLKRLRRRGNGLKSHPTDWEKPGIEPATWFTRHRLIRRVAEIQIFEKTYLIVIKDETGLKFKMNDSTLFLIGSYAQKLVASY